MQWKQIPEDARDPAEIQAMVTEDWELLLGKAGTVRP